MACLKVLVNAFFKKKLTILNQTIFSSIKLSTLKIFENRFKKRLIGFQIVSLFYSKFLKVYICIFIEGERWPEYYRSKKRASRDIDKMSRANKKIVISAFQDNSFFNLKKPAGSRSRFKFFLPLIGRSPTRFEQSAMQK